MALTERDLELRRSSLGASEIGVIAGHGLYRRVTPFTIWEAKVFGSGHEIGDLGAIGHAFEPAIAQLYAEQVGETVHLYRGRRRVHPTERWRSATPDYYVLDRPRRTHKHPDGPDRPEPRRLLECKWVGPGQEIHWDTTAADGVPQLYRDQAEWQMDVCEINEADIAGFFASERRLYIWRFGPDLELREKLISTGAEWWAEHVITQKPPVVDESDAAKRFLRRKYPDNNGEIIVAPPEAQQLAETFVDARDAEKKAKLAKEAAQNQLCELIGENLGIQSFWGRATWKAPARGKTKDSAVIQEFRNMLELRGVSAEELDAVIERHTPPASRRFYLKEETK